MALKYRFYSDPVVIKDRVSVDIEVARKTREMGSSTVIFENVVLRDGSISEYPVVSNIIASREGIAKILNINIGDLNRYFLEKMLSPVEPPVIPARDYYEVEVDLDKLPIVRHYMEEAGPYITGGIIVAEDSEYGLNASYHRMLQLDRDRLVPRIVPRHLHKYIERGLKKFTVCIGSPPEVLIASSMSPPLGVSELSIANALGRVRLIDFDGVLGAEARIVLVCELTGRLVDEGPFIDVTGTLDIVRREPEVRVKKIFVRDDAFYHDILPAGPEHKLLMGFSMQPVILKSIMDRGVDVLDVYLTPGSSSWLHCIVKIRKRDRGDARKAIEAAFEGHKSLKLVIVVDEDIDIYDWEMVEWALATRVQPDRDVYIYRDMVGSSLDPSADPVTRRTSKWGIDATIPDDKRRSDFTRVV